MSTLQRIDGPGDAELISAVRGGDVSAYGELFERHVAAARRLARQLVSHGDVDDLVSDAFAKVLVVLQRGGGPDVAFRAYLLTAVRRLHVDRIRSTSRLTTTDDMEAFDPGIPFRDTAVEGFENAAAAKAFASLPERWQLVLWHTEVEGAKPAEVAELLGMSPNSVSALAYRAREGLRQAFLNMHAQELDEDECRWTNQHIGAYIRKGVSKRDASKVEAHLDECRKCMAIYLELSEVNSNLSAILAPLLLGTAGAAYLAGASGVAAKAGVLGVIGRARDAVTGNSAGAGAGAGASAGAGAGAGVGAVAGSMGTLAVLGTAAAVVTVVGAGVLVATGVIGGNDGSNVADNRPGSSITDSNGRTQDPAATGSTDVPTDTPTDGTTDLPTDGTTDLPTDGTTDLPTDVPSDGTTDGPTDGTTDGPTDGTTDGPTDGTTDGPTGGTTDGPDTNPAPGEDVLPDSDGGPVTFDLLANDANPIDGDLELLRVAQPDHGRVSRGPARLGPLTRAASTGIVTYHPDHQFKGRDSFTYVVANQRGETSEGRVRVTVRNGAPVAVADDQSTNRNAGVDVDVLANDTDPNFDDLSIADFDASSASGGQVSRSGGQLTYTPQRGFRGVDTFGYQVSDGDGGQDRASVTVAVANRAPSADDDSATTDTDTDVDIAVLDGDSDPDGDDLFTAIASRPGHGSVRVNDDGSVTYSPTSGYKGPDSFTYVATDGADQSAPATVDITVRNATPVADDDSATTDTDQPVTVDVLANDSDANGDPLTPEIAAQPSDGTVEVNADGTVTYTPADGFAGEDTFTYRAGDGDAQSAVATVTITVRNAAPVVSDDSATTDTDQPVTVDVLANDADANGDALTPAVVGEPEHGSARVNDDGTITYTPAAGYAGADSFTYRVTDSSGARSGLATVSITVANADPVAVDDSASTDTDTYLDVEVLANDSDANIPGTSQRLLPQIVDQPANGSAAANRDGTVRYTPDAGFAGTDTFTYRLTDGAGGVSQVATVTITVANAAPDARDDVAATDHGTAVDVDVLANDTDPNGDSLAITDVTEPVGPRGNVRGLVTILRDQVRYTPPTGFSGEVTFDYTVSDGNGGTDTATVTITVRNGVPVAQDDTATTAYATATLIDVLANDTDPNDDPLSVSKLSTPDHGKVYVDDDEQVRYTPPAGFSGIARFSYTASDGNGGTDTAEVAVTVENGLPVARDDAATTDTDTEVSIDVLANDTEPNGDPLTIVSTEDPDNGSVRIRDDGSLTYYAPSAGFKGDDSFDYTISDGQGGTATATVRITVRNAAPSATDDSATTAGQRILVPVLANDTDLNRDALSIASFDTRSANKGVVTQEGDQLAYTPVDGFHGTDTFGYVSTDGDGGTSRGTVTVEVTNSAPVAVTDTLSFAAKSENTRTIDVLANDTDLNRDALRILEVTGAGGGTVTIVDNKLRYDYRSDFAGADTFSYVIVDDQGGRARGTVNLTVTNTPPTTVADSATIDPGKAVTISPLLNDSDSNGDAISLSAVSKPSRGTAVIEGSKLVYTPNADFLGGTDTFTYTATDPRGGTSTGTVTVNSRYDLRVTARGSVSGLQHEIFGDVSGIDPSGSATLTISVTGLRLITDVPDGCSLSGSTVTCQLTADTEIGPVRFIGLPTTAWRADFKVTANGFTDADPSNNTDRLP